MAKTNLKLVSPTSINGTVPPRRRPNADLRSREYLTEGEIERLMKAAKDNRYGHRDATMILVAYRHGFRASELVDLRWDQIDFDTATMAVRRAKRGTPSTHPIMGDELRALRKLQREQEPKSPFVFTSERGSPFTTAGFARLVERAGEAAELGFKAHPHMLRHATGFYLANAGQGTRVLSSDDGGLHAGIDVAGPGEDETVAVIRDSPGAIVALQAWGRPDPRGEVAAFLAPYKSRLESVNVDSAGIGYYFGRHLSDLGYLVNSVNVGAAPSSPAKFGNLKAQLYWALRERFEAGEVAGLTDELTLSQLASIRYEHNPRGQVVIESKEDARKRGVKSPDRAEAVMLAYSNRDPMALAKAWYKSVALRQRAEDEAWAQGKPPPPTPGEEMYKRCQARAAKWLQKIQEFREIQEREDLPNKGRILPSIVNYVTRRPA